MIEFKLDWLLLGQFALASILPLLVGIVTTEAQSPAFKAVALAGLALVSGLLTEWLAAATAGDVYDLGAGLLRFAAVFIVSVTTYFGIWSRPNANGTSATAYLQENVGRTSN